MIDAIHPKMGYHAGQLHVSFRKTFFFRFHHLKRPQNGFKLWLVYMQNILSLVFTGKVVTQTKNVNKNDNKIKNNINNNSNNK